RDFGSALRIVAGSYQPLQAGFFRLVDQHEFRLGCHHAAPNAASQPLAAARARAVTSSTLMPGLKRLEPSPNIVTPAARSSEKSFSETPPTAPTGMSAG